MPPNGQTKLSSAPEPQPSAEDLARLVCKLPVPVWVFDALLHVVYFNDEAVQFHEGGEIGASIKSFSPEFKKALAPLLHDSVSTDEILNFEGWITTPMRGKNYLQITTVPLPHDQVACVVTNQTAFKSAELAVMKSEERYRELVDSLAEGISVIDRTGVCEFANPAMERILGVASGKLLGRPINDFLEFGDMSIADSQRPAAQRNDPAIYETCYTRPDGESRDLLISVVARLDTRGQRIGTLALTQDITLLKRVEEALRQERNFTAAVIDTASALVVVLDRQGRIIRFNRGCEVLTGYQANEVIGKTVWDSLLIPQEIEAVKIIFSELSAKSSPLTFENNWLTKEGETRLISWSNSIVLDNEGEVEFVVGIGVDITERSEAAEMLYQSEKTSRALLDAQVDPALLVTPDCVIAAVNEAAAADGGHAAEEVIGKRFDELLPPEIGARRAAVIKQVSDSKEPYRYMDEAEGKWYDVTVRPILDSNNQVILLAIHARDITGYKQAEHKLLASEARFRTLVEAMHECVGVCDKDLNITFVNQALCNKLGYGKDELIGKNMLNVAAIDAEGRKVVERQIQLRISGSTEPYEMYLVKKDGAKVYMHVTPQYIVSDVDSTDYSFAIYQEIEGKE